MAKLDQSMLNKELNVFFSCKKTYNRILAADNFQTGLSTLEDPCIQCFA